MNGALKEFCKALIETTEEVLNGIENNYGCLIDEICCQETEPAKTARLALLAGIMLGARAEEYRVEVNKR